MQKPPRSPCVLNRSHPHAKGLTAAYFFNDYGCSVAHDFSGLGNDIPLTNTTWDDGGLVANSSGEYGSLDNTNNVVIDSECGTVISYIKGHTAPDDGLDRYVIGTGSNKTGDFYLSKLTDDRLYFLLKSSANHYVGIDDGNFPNWVTGTQLSCCWDSNKNVFDGKKLAINIDGKFLTPDRSLNATTINSFTVSSTLKMLNNASDTNGYLNGVCQHMYVYNYSLPEFLINDIYENSYSMVIK